MKIFLHGLESSSKGAKGSFLHDLYPEMVIPDFTGNLSARMQLLNQILDGHENITLVGSSFGGLMATIYAMENHDRIDRVILLAPALNFPEFSRYTIHRLTTPAWMIIGRYDTVTPAAVVAPTAKKIFANLRYNEVDDDHMLAKTFRGLAWKSLLGN